MTYDVVKEAEKMNHLPRETFRAHPPGTETHSAPVRCPAAALPRWRQGWSQTRTGGGIPRTGQRLPAAHHCILTSPAGTLWWPPQLAGRCIYERTKRKRRVDNEKVILPNSWKQTIKIIPLLVAHVFAHACIQSCSSEVLIFPRQGATYVILEKKQLMPRVIAK